MTNERDRLIDAALEHVIFDGMTDKAVLAGARDIGMSEGMAHVHLPRGGADLAAAYHRRGDAALRDWLAHTPLQGRFRDRICDAVMHRLTLSDREMARAGAVVFALPQNAALGARLVWESADAIWEGLGDTSEDVNWYSKRATLSAVYGATALYWLGDDTPELDDTRAFLERRIDGVMRFEKIKGKLAGLPMVGALASRATGWIRRPARPSAPGHVAPLPHRAAERGDA